MKRTNYTEESNKILAKIALNSEHLRFVNDTIDEIYNQPGDLTDCNEAELDYLYGEKEETQKRIGQLMKEYRENIYTDVDTCTGKIIIEYKNLPDDVRFDLYRHLNRFFLEFPEFFNYKTVENTVKYSKDFAYDDEDYSE